MSTEAPARYEAAEVKARARNRWLEIYQALAGTTFLTDREGPCPKCQGNTRCRMSDMDGDGSVICSHCHKGGDGFAGLQWLLGISFPEAVQLVGEYLGATPAPTRKPDKAKDSREPAPVEIRDRVYRLILARLRLSDAHRQNLRDRGLSDATIDLEGYRTLDKSTGEDRTACAAATAGLNGFADRIPGVNGGLIARSGILIPVRNLAGQIVALKVRRDEVQGDDPRYTYVSSRECSCGSPVHVPKDAAGRHSRIRATEGELKATIATELSGLPTITAGSVSNWKKLEPVLREMGASTVVLAFDADSATNEKVAKQLGSAHDGLTAAGFNVELEVWDPSQGKGIDDLLLAGGKPTILTDVGAAAWLDKITGREPATEVCTPDLQTDGPGFDESEAPARDDDDLEAQVAELRGEAEPRKQLEKISSSPAAKTKDEQHEQEEHDSAPTIDPAFYSMPGFVEQVMQYTLESAPYPSPELAFCGALGLLTVITGRKVCGPTGLGTNLYILALANSGSGKDWPRNVNARILAQANMTGRVASRAASGQGLEELIYQQPTLLLMADEFDSVMAQINRVGDAIGSELAARLMELYSRSQGTYFLRAKANDEEQRRIERPSLSLLATAVPSSFFGELTPKVLANGLVARMLTVQAGQRGRGQDVRQGLIPQSIIDQCEWWRDFNPSGGNVGDFTGASPRVVEFDEDAREIFKAARRANEDEYSRFEAADDNAGMAIMARVDELSLKLAVLYACSADRRTPEVKEEAALWATKFASVHARWLLAQVEGRAGSETRLEQIISRVLRRLKRHRGTLSWGEALKASKVGAKEFADIATTMKERGQVNIDERRRFSIPR